MKRNTLLLTTVSLMLTAPSLLEASSSLLRRPPLFQAIDAKDENRVRSLIQSGEDVNAEYSAGHQLLHAAASFSTPVIIRALLQAGAGANARNVHGQTPLHCAAKFGHIDTAQALCEHGADATACDLQGNSPLHEAASIITDNHELLQLLLSNGANAAARNAHRLTPMDKALAHSHIEKMRILLKHGASLPQNLSSNHYLNDAQKADLERCAQNWAQNVEEVLMQEKRDLPTNLVQLVREFATRATPSDTAPSTQDEQAALPAESAQLCTLL